MWSGNPGINGTEFLSAFSESLVSSFDEDLCIVILQTEAWQGIIIINYFMVAEPESFRIRNL